MAGIKKINDAAQNFDDIECFVMDMDGTLYLGETPIDGAVDFYNRAKRAGKKILFFTNNSSKSPLEYVDKLNRLGFVGAVREDILTSGDVTIDYIKSKVKSPRVYLAATPALCRQFEQAGITLCGDGEKNIDFAVLGFDTTFNFEKANALCKLVSGKTPFLATNVDKVCPLEGGAFLPDCGSMAAMIAHATGREAKFLGKPYSPTIQYILKYTNINKDKIAMVGDRLYTDIKTAKDGGFTAIAVLSGEITQSDIDASEIAPDYILNSVADIKFS